MYLKKVLLVFIAVSILTFAVIFYGCSKDSDVPTEVENDPVVVFESYRVAACPGEQYTASDTVILTSKVDRIWGELDNCARSSITSSKISFNLDSVSYLEQFMNSQTTFEINIPEDWYVVGDNKIDVEVQTSSGIGSSSMFIRYIPFEMYMGSNFSLQTFDSIPVPLRIDIKYSLTGFDSSKVYLRIDGPDENTGYLDYTSEMNLFRIASDEWRVEYDYTPIFEVEGTVRVELEAYDNPSACPSPTIDNWWFVIDL